MKKKPGLYQAIVYLIGASIAVMLKGFLLMAGVLVALKLFN